MIEVGQKVRFDPFRGMTGEGVVDLRKKVTGTVVYVNKAHKWFSVVWGNPMAKTSFKFVDIDEVVKVIG